MNMINHIHMTIQIYYLSEYEHAFARHILFGTKHTHALNTILLDRNYAYDHATNSNADTEDRQERRTDTNNMKT